MKKLERKHLLGLSDVSSSEIELILETAGAARVSASGLCTDGTTDKPAEGDQTPDAGKEDTGK